MRWSDWSYIVRLIFALLLTLLPSGILVASGNVNRQLSASSALDYMILMAAVVLPMAGGFVALRLRSRDGNVPVQLKAAAEIIKALRS